MTNPQGITGGMKTGMAPAPTWWSVTANGLKAMALSFGVPTETNHPNTTVYPSLTKYPGV